MPTFTPQEWARFERGVAAAQSGTLAKLMSSPVHLGRSKWLEVRARRSGKARLAQGRTFWGQPFHVAFPERVSMTVYRYGYFEEDLTRAFTALLKPGMTFLDVGSHFGYFSLLAAHLVAPGGQVYAFEPTPSTFEMLCRNTESNPRITRVNAAASSREGTHVFLDHGLEFSAFNSLMTSRLEPHEKLRARVREVQVRTLTLDSYIQERGLRPDVVKVDAEGAEMEVLRGLERTLREVRPVVSLEMGDIGKSEGPSPSRALVDHMIATGYRPLETAPGGLRPHSPLTSYPYMNILFEPA